MAANPEFFPDYASLGSGLPPSAAAPEPNYLNHPTPYYVALGQLWDDGVSVEGQMLKLRLINVAVASFAIIIMLAAGAMAFPDLSGRAVFSSVLVLFPKTPGMAGFVNNDSLVLVATGIVFAGLLRLADQRDTRAGLLVGAGLALAGWTKLTALVMLGTAALLVVLLVALNGRAVARRTLLTGASIAAIGAIPTFANLLSSGKIIWSSPTHNAVPEALRPDLSAGEFLLHFLQNLALKWPAFEPAAPIQLACLAAVLLICLAGAFFILPTVLRREQPEPLALVAGAFLLALPISIGIHTIYGWSAFLAIGDLTSAQMRYYAPLWPGIALAMTLVHRQIVSPRHKVIAALLMGELLLVCSPFTGMFQAEQLPSI
ncbi:hypothetical protein [Sphingomonas swuensis]